ncbi:WXG100 family type VII secretion target [Streptomyces shenzhenensis]|uniref:WXG100 family type VII secretion target n=1 Tax=Streptomyces shenzhenensis TaxID=943815 RepID=UPI0033CA4840
MTTPGESPVTTTVGGVTYRVTPEYLSGAATTCDSTASEIAGMLADLKLYVQSLEASWQGVAATTFATLMVTYDLHAQMLYDALTDIGGGLRGTYASYKDSEVWAAANVEAIQLPAANLS